MIKICLEIFNQELKAAGLLGLPFSYSEDGIFTFDDSISEEDKNAVLSIYDAHDYEAAKVEMNKKNLFVKLMTLCDSKQEEAENFILKHKNTAGQRRRYQDKYERALAGEFSPEERSAMITNYESVRDAIRAFADLIEFFRQAVDDWIVDEQLEKAERAIAEAASFRAETKLDDVKMLLANVEAEQ